MLSLGKTWFQISTNHALTVITTNTSKYNHFPSLWLLSPAPPPWKLAAPKACKTLSTWKHYIYISYWIACYRLSSEMARKNKSPGLSNHFFTEPTLLRSITIRKDLPVYSKPKICRLLDPGVVLQSLLQTPKWCVAQHSLTLTKLQGWARKALSLFPLLFSARFDLLPGSANLLLKGLFLIYMYCSCYNCRKDRALDYSEKWTS